MSALVLDAGAFVAVQRHDRPATAFSPVTPDDLRCLAASAGKAVAIISG